ncbi:MAG: hypothetical protein H6839_05860 [Planctomycetes bacterium]|nr:hypothetical protein [Planctomycetota bacterium]
MKSPILPIALVAAVVGGAVGALLVGILQDRRAPQSRSDGGVDAATFDDTALRDVDRRNAEAIQQVLNRLGELEVRLEKAENERNDLKQTNKALGVELQELKAAPDVKSAEDPPDVRSEVDRAVKEALEAEREKKKADETAAGLKAVDQKMKAATDRALKDLQSRLGLTAAQSDRVAEVFNTMNQRVMELTTEAAAAKQSREEFDWSTRWNDLMTETETLIRDELSTAQLASFDEALGERGISGILWPEK